MPTAQKIVIYVALLAAALLVAALVRWIVSLLPARRLPYFSRQSLLTDGELAFYRVFRAAVPPGLAVSMKVRLADVINCDGRAFKEGYFGKISSKHLDFVVIDSATTRIRFAVELDDRSHRHRHRAERDAFLDGAMAAAGITLLRFPAAASYDPRELRDIVQAALDRRMT